MFFLLLRCLWACVWLFFVVLFGINNAKALKLKAFTDKLAKDVEQYEIDSDRKRFNKAYMKAKWGRND